jgi:NAD+ diphosphatase
MPLNAFTNIFAGNPLDRASEKRSDPDWLRARADDPRSHAIALWNGAPLVTSSDEDNPRLAYLSLPLVTEMPRIDEQLLFLGLRKDTAIFAVEFDGDIDPSEGLFRGLGWFENLRAVAMRLPPAEAAIAATAKAVFEWQRRHKHCATCGELSHIVDGGWKRVCSACATQHFPRTDPVVIMLAVRGDTCLLGRQAAWPPGMWSALAGFMEPGESIEEACARELKEEAALDTRSVRYHSSQPWPYPSSLMIGLIAEAAAGDAVPDLTEIEAVRWFTRAEALKLLSGEMEGAFAPPGSAIAHQLIKAWAEEAEST